AIDAVAGRGGGTVFLPEGRYLLKGHLVLKNAVTLRGEWQAPDKAGVVGTVLMPVEHRGDAEGESAIVMQCGSGLRELSIWYPEQEPEAIAPYPWTIETTPEAGVDNYTLHNVTLVNVYRGFKTGPEANELHTLKNVYMTALETGVFIDSCTDIGRVIDIDISPRWWIESGLPGSPKGGAAETSLRSHVAREATGIDMGRSDWEYLYGVHIEGCQRGLVIRQGAQGTTNAVLYGSALEDCTTAVHLEELNGIGLAAVGCRFDGARHALYATEAFDTVSQFNACTFASPEGHGVLLEGDGTLTFQNCVFETWGTSGVEAAAGAVSLLGCGFQSPSTHVKLRERVSRARLLGNTFAGQPDVENAASGADVMMAHRAMVFDVPDVSRPPAPPVPAPGSREVVMVTEHGAGPDLDDNTGAFQAALAAAERLGGATVYVPAGYYRFRGSLTVPPGVELR
ncbi:MAG TPA: glycosyl hydrolase family 28-related protein, partial [Candidatus Hydrogenedentes bacterium]|nr:glycosyl hydrolase family 28-related protein [Candidatus Hydrogenedentota bacterium]